MKKLSFWDRVSLSVAPKWAMGRMKVRAQADVFARNYEAASFGRRTSGWARSRGDSNAVGAVARAELMMHARDLVRNNAWAMNGQRVIARNTVGWGITPKPVAESQTEVDAAVAVWKSWADTTECESERRLTFPGIQELVMRAIATDGEILIRRRLRLPKDGLTVPMQLQVLEADFLDSSKDQPQSDSGGPIVQGVEYDLLGRRAAYWLFNAHPGSGRATGISSRVSAEEIIHVFRQERPGQTRGISWFASAIVNMKDLDEYEDAELLKQKIASFFTGIVTDDGTGGGVLPDVESNPTDPMIKTFEPGMFTELPPGKQVTFGNPPVVTEGSFANRNLRRIAAGLGVTYEELTGDFSQVNFSSARMARLAHWANVHSWQYNMLIPMLCDRVWAWAMDAAVLAGKIRKAPRAEWSTPPMPMIEPEKEGLAYQRLLRTGAIHFGQMIRELGGDPEAHMKEIANWNKRMDELKIKLDGDPRAVSQAGLTQERAGGSSGEKPPPPEREEERSTEPEISPDAKEGVLAFIRGGGKS